MTLREVRLHHWRQLMAVRKMQRQVARDADYVTDARDLEFKLRNLAHRHLSAVQCLNDYVSGTAERDDAETPETETMLLCDVQAPQDRGLQPLETQG